MIAKAGNRRFVVVSGLPGSGKTTVGRALASLLDLPHIDKDDILESLFESRGIGDAGWRRRLSREADTVFQAAVSASAGAVITSFWHATGMSPDSGTPTGWLAELPGVIANVHCECPPAVAAERFVRRTRHAGHRDGTRTAADVFASFEALGGAIVSAGPRVTVDTTRPLDAEAVRRAVETAWIGDPQSTRDGRIAAARS